MWQYFWISDFDISETNCSFWIILRGSHSLSARWARRTKSRGPKGLPLRAPRVLNIWYSVFYIFSLIVKRAVLSMPLFMRVLVSSIIDILRVILSPSSTYIGFWFRQKSDLENVKIKISKKNNRRKANMMISGRRKRSR